MGKFNFRAFDAKPDDGRFISQEGDFEILTVGDPAAEESDTDEDAIEEIDPEAAPEIKKTVHVWPGSDDE